MTLSATAWTLLHVSSDAWTAIGTWGLIAVGIGAAFYARSQLREAKKLREEQTQPYVAVFADESRGSDRRNTDIVVKNFGVTAATNVQVRFSPPPDSVTLGRTIELPKTIPVLVPGQEWRTFWEFTPHRCDASGKPKPDLTSRFTAVVAFSDSQHRPIQTQYRFDLDWEAITGRGFVDSYGIHDIAKNTAEIDRTLGQMLRDQRAFHGGSPLYSQRPQTSQSLRPDIMKQLLGDRYQPRPEPPPESRPGRRTRWTRIWRRARS